MRGSRAGLTLLAERTGIPQHHISEMENGKRTLGWVRAKKLAMHSTAITGG